MSPNRRILLNIVATYGRSLFGLACGLFSARWVLEALGKEDFGLYGVVGALTIFIAFLNMMLSGALGRYYAFSIGEANRATHEGRAADGLENCRRWFNTALSIHTVVPVALMLIGYPIGEWAVRNFLTIPADRLDTCVWVFRLACISSFVGMINVPFTAMYTAKQYIAELTIYSFAQTAANTAFFYFMATHPGAWLMKYAIWMCVVAIAPEIIITLRAFIIFRECRINLAYWWDLARFKQLGSYALWQMFGGFGYIFRKAMRGRIAAVGCSSMGAGSIGGKNYCGNLLWQSRVTPLPPMRGRTCPAGASRPTLHPIDHDHRVGIVHSKDCGERRRGVPDWL